MTHLTASEIDDRLTLLGVPAELRAEIVDRLILVDTHVLVPRGGDWAVGDFSPDDWAQFAGKRGLILELNPEQCRAVASALGSHVHATSTRGDAGVGNCGSALGAARGGW